MKRTSNLSQRIEQSQQFHNRFNPLFDLFKNEFDRAFKSEEEEIDHILDNYYVDSRDGKDFTNNNVMAYITKKFDIEKLEDLDRNVYRIKGKLFLLVGKKGIGKTTLLNAYLRYLNQSISADNRIVSVYIDLKNFKDDVEFKSQLVSNIYKEIKIYISENLPDIHKYLCEYPYMCQLDSLFKDQPKEWLARHFLEKEPEIIDKLFRCLKNNGYVIIIMIDNVDDFSVRDIKAIIDRAQYMRNHYKAKCLVAIRDHWNPRDLRVDDRTIAALNLYRPIIKEIVFKRLDAVNEAIESNVIKEGWRLTYGDNESKIILSGSDIIDTYKIICEEFADNSAEFYDDIYKLSNYDIRDLLENVYHFFHSPYLYSRPIFSKALIQKFKDVDCNFSEGITRRSQFFDYLGGFMTPHTLHYDATASNIFNIFYHGDLSGQEPDFRNTLIYIRILENVPEQTHQPIEKEQLVNNMKDIGYDTHLTEMALTKLLQESLLESPDGVNYSDVSIINLSAKGDIYLNTLIYQFTYLLFICDAVPMPYLYQYNIREKFGVNTLPLKKGGSLDLKIKSVQRFIDFLEYEEGMEYNHCNRNNRWRLDDIGELSEKIRNKIDPQIARLRNSENKRSIKEIKNIEKVVIN